MKQNSIKQKSFLVWLVLFLTIFLTQSGQIYADISATTSFELWERDSFIPMYDPIYKYLFDTGDIYSELPDQYYLDSNISRSIWDDLWEVTQIVLSLGRLVQDVLNGSPLILYNCIETFNTFNNTVGNWGEKADYKEVKWLFWIREPFYNRIKIIFDADSDDDQMHWPICSITSNPDIGIIVSYKEENNAKKYTAIVDIDLLKFSAGMIGRNPSWKLSEIPVCFAIREANQPIHTLKIVHSVKLSILREYGSDAEPEMKTNIFYSEEPTSGDVWPIVCEEEHMNYVPFNAMYPAWGSGDMIDTFDLHLTKYNDGNFYCPLFRNNRFEEILYNRLDIHFSYTSPAVTYPGIQSGLTIQAKPLDPDATGILIDGIRQIEPYQYSMNCQDGSTRNVWSDYGDASMIIYPKELPPSKFPYGVLFNILDPARNNPTVCQQIVNIHIFQASREPPPPTLLPVTGVFFFKANTSISGTFGPSYESNVWAINSTNGDSEPSKSITLKCRKRADGKITIEDRECSWIGPRFTLKDPLRRDLWIKAEWENPDIELPRIRISSMDSNSLYRFRYAEVSCNLSLLRPGKNKLLRFATGKYRLHFTGGYTDAGKKDILVFDHTIIFDVGRRINPNDIHPDRLRNN